MHDRKRLKKRDSHRSLQAPSDRANRRPTAHQDDGTNSKQRYLIVGSFAICVVTLACTWVATSLAREASSNTQVAATTPIATPVQPHQEPSPKAPQAAVHPQVIKSSKATLKSSAKKSLPAAIAPPQTALFADSKKLDNDKTSILPQLVRSFREEKKPVYGPQPDPAGGSGADFDSLIELITTTVSPDTWEDVGGPGTIDEYETGVRADPLGQMDKNSKIDNQGRLKALAAKLRDADLNSQVTSGSELRIVSLPRLERAVAEHAALGQELPEALRYLAGMTAVRYVFVYPEDGDVVIAGPAEPWELDEEGRPLGVDSGRPILQLDDLVVMLRVFAPSGQGIFGCSINPRQQNLKQVKEFVEASQAAGPLAPGTRGRWLKELRNRMGMQDIEIYGVPRETRVAKIIFDADYRMKLIGIGKMDAGPNVPDIFKLMRRNRSIQGLPLQALRWWLTMKYDGIHHSPARDAFEIRGSSVLVQSENQFVTAQGKRIQTGKAEPINREFAENFTNHYDEVAERDVVFTELQNVFDLAMAAAICRRDGLFEQVGWDMGEFSPQGRYQVAEVETPEEIESVMNHRLYGGKDIVVQVAGGVVGHVEKYVNNKDLQNESAELDTTHKTGKLAQTLAGRWWWDANK